jgi:hypothetical protein
MADFAAGVSSTADALVGPVRELLEQVLNSRPIPGIDIDVAGVRLPVPRRLAAFDYALNDHLNLRVFDLARTLDLGQRYNERSTINVSDIATGLADLKHQADILRGRSERFPIARLEEQWIPILSTPGSVDPRNIQVLVQGRLRDLEISTTEPDQLPTLMAQPLAQFLAFRIFAAATGLANVEVSTITTGWQVFYSPPHVLQQNGFGTSLTTPVLGYVPPGNWRFGISNAGTIKLDQTRWPIPPNLHAPIPHKVPLTL